jgi:hypothetical protein
MPPPQVPHGADGGHSGVVVEVVVLVVVVVVPSTGAHTSLGVRRVSGRLPN